jgi:phage shock protein A
MAIGAIGSLWSLARRVEDLFQLQTKVRDSLEIIDARLRAIEDRVIRLEAEQRQIIIEARSAASAASTMIVGNVISDAVTRITRLEGRAEQLERRRFAPPER